MKINSQDNLSPKIEAYIIHSVLIIVSALFLLFFSMWTSPFYKHWLGCDASFFSMAGRSITKGFVPYRDFFDLKGPVFFFIEALGQLIHNGKWGIYIIQIPFLSASLILIYETARLFIGRAKSIAVILIVLILHLSVLWGGNCLEEFALPLNLLVLFLTLKQYKHHSTEPLPHKIPLITGICFSLIMFSKITAAAPIIGIVIATVIVLLINKQSKGIFYYCLYFILGFLIIFIPIALYFYCNKALLRMLYCVFIIGFKRSKDVNSVFTLSNELRLLGCEFSVFVGLFHMPCISSLLFKIQNHKNASKDSLTKKTYTLPVEISLVLICQGIVSYILLHLGGSFIYYYMTTYPCIILGLIMLMYLYNPLALFNNIYEGICLLLLGVLLYTYLPDSINIINNNLINRNDESYQQEYWQDSLDIAALIPMNERNSVFSFDIDMKWYEATGILPCNPYQVNLQYFISLDPSIDTELKQYFKQTPPKWMLVSHNLPNFLPEFNDIIEADYECIYDNSVGMLYLHY